MPSVAEFLCERLENAGIKHIFGARGFYVDGLITVIKQSGKILFVENVDESYSGFSADAYARTNGLGCVCVNYNTGTLKLCSSIAGAYAERSPVIVISGSPGIKERNNDFSSNHLVESFNFQKEIFDHITSHSVVLDDPTTAGWKIDNALNVLKETKQPVYIELPKDVATQPIKYDVYTQGTPDSQKSDLSILKEAIDDVSSILKNSSNPVLVMGVQITRFNLEDSLVKFAEKHNIPIVNTFLSKSSVSEDHPLFSGIYFGEKSNDTVRNLVDNSDCLLIFGEMLTDATASFVTPKFNNSNSIFCSVESLRVKNHIYCNIKFLDFCRDFFKCDVGKKSFNLLPKKQKIKFTPQDSQKLTSKRFFEKINSVLNSNFVVLADLRENVLEAAELVVPHHGFVSSSFYLSKGLAVSGSLGVQISRPHIRPLVLVGDDSFRTSLIEISTILKNKLNPIIFILGKSTSCKDWNYDKVFDMIVSSPGVGYTVDTEEGLDSVVDRCLVDKGLSVISVLLDCSPADRSF